MPHDLPKAYDPTAIEDHWAEYWVRENLFAQPTPELATASETGARPASQAFTILLPPPNVTGRLHMGHMLNQTEMDILTRWRRMSDPNHRALWLPGTDHAGIATQMMVERQLTEEGTTRQQLGREAFVERVWEWKRHYGGAILSQMKRLGASVDWQREYFTMDDNLSVAVREAFVRLYEQDLIYRGAYIVNWCPRCQTAISDVEVVYDEHKGHLWEIRYPVLDDAGNDSGEFLTVATTRPETMLGDTAVAIHPEDERYLHLHGKKLRLPLSQSDSNPAGREIPIILDTWVSRDFGTGAVKVTPAHDPNDFALGQRHNLPNINIMDETAHINNEGGKYKGLDRYVARKRIVADLEELGLLAGVKDHTNSIGHCDRCKTVVEPRLSTQWFVAVNKAPKAGGASMADKARAVVRPDAEGKKAIRFTPEQYEKTYLNWMENIYDWCISRQLWWGHRIPAWHCGTCGKITVARVDPTNCSHCGSVELKQETDVLDTWFSSGLLPVSVFGWPNFTGSHIPQTLGNHETGSDSDNDLGAPSFPRTSAERVGEHEPQAEAVKGTGFSPYINHPAGEGALAPEGQNCTDAALSGFQDFAAFYPTSLLVTGFDILFFWVARMIMLGCWFAGDVPMPDGSKRSLADSVPFREVYIHALVRDANKEKMSKTKGNVVDPIEIVKQFGTDAVRFTLASMASPGTDIAFNVARTEGYRAFANKIWNAARFLFQNVDRAAEIGVTVDLPTPHLGLSIHPHDGTLANRWITSRLASTAGRVDIALGAYRFDEAASLVYQFFWGDFCDWYLEIAKEQLDYSDDTNSKATQESLQILVGVFEAALRLLSPFMPFLTEELWHAMYDGKPPTKSIALYPYPTETVAVRNGSAEGNMATLQELIIETRAARKVRGVEEKIAVPLIVYSDAVGIAIVRENQRLICRLAKISEVRFAHEPIQSPTKRSTANFDLDIVYEAAIDFPAERDRLTKDVAKYEKGLAAAERQLGNEGFLAKAPAHIIEGLKKQESETRLLLEKARAALNALPED